MKTIKIPSDVDRCGEAIGLDRQQQMELACITRKGKLYVSVDDLVGWCERFSWVPASYLRQEILEQVE